MGTGFQIWLRDKGLTCIFKESESHPCLVSSQDETVLTALLQRVNFPSFLSGQCPLFSLWTLFS